MLTNVHQQELAEGGIPKGTVGISAHCGWLNSGCGGWWGDYVDECAAEFFCKFEYMLKMFKSLQPELNFIQKLIIF